jgi:hypothetical protein
MGAWLPIGIGVGLAIASGTSGRLCPPTGQGKIKN